MSKGCSRGSQAVTDGFRVTVQPCYMIEHSNPADDKYLFSYTITITNESTRRARLCSRHWIIVDADGGRHDVRGEGVVGETPVLAPGTSYRYSSFCPLPTEWGTMEGTYLMEADNGEVFEIAVARFYLVASPIHTLMKA
jgi:ApaG protein